MTRKLNNFICVMLAVCVHIVCTTQGERCEQLTYLSPSGLTCFYCIPGTYKVEDCKTNYTGALCTKCPKNTYQRNCNRAESCEPCNLQCEARSKKVQNCTLYENIICECQEGHYLYREPSTDGVCVQHNSCKVGYGMVNPGNPYNDTECKVCDNGTFSNTTSFDRCRLCRKCENYKTLCTTKKDAECQDASDRPTQTTERSDGFKGQFNILVVLNSLILLILSICVFIILCVLIYASKKCKLFQDLWENCSCCSNCRKGSQDHRKKPILTEEQEEQKKPNPALKLDKVSDKISQKKPIPAEEQDEVSDKISQQKPIPAEEQDEVSEKISNLSTTEKEENQESVPDYSEEVPLMTENKAKQSNVNLSHSYANRQCVWFPSLEQKVHSSRSVSY